MRIGRGQAHRLVRARGADVGQLLALERVHLEVVVAAVLADDHAAVDLLLRADEHAAAVLEPPERVGDRDAVLDRDQHAGAAAGDRPLVGRPAVEDAVQDAGAAGVGQELAVVADQAARRDVRDDAGLAGARGLHLDHLGAARAGDLLEHGAGVVVVDVDGDFLDRLELLAVVLAEENARARDRQLEALAAHVLDQDAHLQLAAAGDLEGVAAGGVGDADGDVRLRLLEQALADDAGLDLAAVAPGEGRVVDAEGDRDRRRVDRLGRQGDVDRERGDRVGDGRLGHAREGDDVAGHRLVDGLRRQAAERQDLGDAELLDLLAHARDRLHRGAGAQPPALDPAGEDAADEGVGRQRGGEHAERLVDVAGLARGRDVADDQVEEGAERLALGPSSSVVAQPARPEA